MKNVPHHQAVAPAVHPIALVPDSPAPAAYPGEMPSARLLYDRKGAARQLSMSVSALDILTANKELATLKQGKKVMYSYAELRRYAKKSHPDPIRGKRPKKPETPPEKEGENAA